MRKFRIVSQTDKFTGEIIIGFNDKGVINLVDTTDTKFGAKSMTKLFEILPKDLGKDLIKTLSDLSSTANFKITEIPADLTFERFWNTYDHKINKKRCIPLYNKLSDADKFLAITKIKDYKSYLSWQQWRGTLDPEKWLRDRQFETEWKKLKR